MTDKLTQAEVDVLMQALTGGSGEVCRNYYCANPSHHAWQAIVSLLQRGYLYLGEWVPGRMSRYYHVTPEGGQAIGMPAPHDRRMSVSMLCVSRRSAVAPTG